MDSQSTTRAPSGPDTPVVVGKRRGRLAFAASLVAIAGVVAALVALLLRRQGVLLPPQEVGPATTVAWQVYHDPLGLFTMRLPPGWTASSGLGSFTEGDRTASMSGQDENIRFSDLSLGAASASISVWAYPITNPALAKRMECTSRPQETGTFNGYPSTPIGSPTILFDSENAHFQIDETIPGLVAPSNLGGGPRLLTPQPQPTPLPTATVTADRSLLSEALASFQPTDRRPLSCP